MALEQLLHLLPLHRIDNGRMFAVVEFFLVTELARVGGVGQEFVQVAFDKGLTTHLTSFAGHPGLGPPTSALQLLNYRQQGLVLQVEIKDSPDSDCFLRVDHQPENLGVNIVAQDRQPSGPFSLAPGRCDLVPRALGDDLTLELGKGQEHIEDQASH